LNLFAKPVGIVIISFIMKIIKGLIID